MFQGSMVALVTPMNADDSINKTSLRQLVDYHIEQQTDAIIAVGTTGEAATLTHDEHCEVIQIVVEQVAGRIPVIAGTGSNSTAEAIDYTRYAQQAGAAGCLLVTPYYNKPTQEGLYLHYKKIAEAVDIPQLLYNVPGRTACDLLPETVKRLAQIDNIVGIKEAVGDQERINELLKIATDQFIILSGDDATAMELILRGGKGTISVTANVAPQAMHAMCQQALAGDRAGAEAINQRLMGLHKNLFIEPNPIPVKWAVHTLGLIPPGIRLPLTPLSPKHYETVKQAMYQAQVLS
ncbi:dihydrodipicolinate synthase [Thioploca ingrica]|uniref:4-hydroxy-tetrahydrodipicolinate synthase n=1 Tax=Thioploca ingrica TaxID=40754 RepID=A0A090AGP6_9GAMM|nr:dihydrodipicolinate synthase [Thioploca ingrica]